MNIEDIFQNLQSKFGNSVVELNKSLIEPFIVVNPLEVDKISYYLRDDEKLQFDNLMLLSGVDDANGKRNSENIIEGGTLSVYYHIESTSLNHKVVIKVSTSREVPEVTSVEPIWKTANWHEREAFDLLGIVFLNHPDLRRILMPEDWEGGYPLRKDYKNPEFYQGMKVPY